jgi:hypothetical protein
MFLITQLNFSQDKFNEKTSELFDIEKLILNNADKLKNNPVIALNEKKVSKAELQNLKLKNTDISKLRIIPKDNLEMVDVYGLQSLNGVILIESGFFVTDYSFKSIKPKNKMLYILNDNIIEEKEFSKINASIIENFKIVNDKKLMTAYTQDNYDAIILIKTK